MKYKIYKMFAIYVAFDKIYIGLVDDNFDEYVNLYYIYFRFLNKKILNYIS